jgi:F0F1-type ATP synthase membrane subunit c/vacuolar-type H+-ATPase subunit K
MIKISDMTNYKVFPDAVPPISTWDKVQAGLWMGLTALLFGGPFACAGGCFVGALARMESMNKDWMVWPPLQWMIIPVSLTALGGVVLGAYSAQSAMKEEVRKKSEEAQKLTSELLSLLGSSLEIPSKLGRSLESACSFLQRCRLEYEENAYGPFWDAVEKVTESFAIFRRLCDLWSQNAREYYSKLQGRKHNFPDFPVRSDSIPDPLPLLKEFLTVIRSGQTNYGFASIWEQRKTREVLVAGFRTLGEAVENLSSVVQEGLSALQDSFDSATARLVQEEIATRESMERLGKEQKKMLDNIQRGRKPLI